MKSPPSNRKIEQKSKIQNTKIRTADDLELIKIILEENSQLKVQVLKVLEQALGKSVKNR